MPRKTLSADVDREGSNKKRKINENDIQVEKENIQTGQVNEMEITAQKEKDFQQKSEKEQDKQKRKEKKKERKAKEKKEREKAKKKIINQLSETFSKKEIESIKKLSEGMNEKRIMKEIDYLKKQILQLEQDLASVNSPPKKGGSSTSPSSKKKKSKDVQKSGSNKLRDQINKIIDDIINDNNSNGNVTIAQLLHQHKAQKLKHQSLDSNNPLYSTLEQKSNDADDDGDDEKNDDDDEMNDNNDGDSLLVNKHEKDNHPNKKENHSTNHRNKDSDKDSSSSSSDSDSDSDDEDAKSKKKKVEVNEEEEDLIIEQINIPEHCVPVRADVRSFNWKALASIVKFDVIVMDPPWQLAGRAPTRGVALGYSQLPNKDIIEMPIESLQENGFIFIWVINSRYSFALQMMKQWGYRMVDDISWVKSTVNRRLAKGHGFYLQHAKETCLVGKKGKDPPGMKGNMLSDVIFSERRGQSQKPEELYEMIEQFIPNGNYLEIFARRNNLRNYWVSIGNEL